MALTIFQQIIYHKAWSPGRRAASWIELHNVSTFQYIQMCMS